MKWRHFTPSNGATLLPQVASLHTQVVPLLGGATFRSDPASICAGCIFVWDQFVLVFICPEPISLGPICPGPTCLGPIYPEPTCLRLICPGAHLSRTHLSWCPFVRNPFVWDSINYLGPTCLGPICPGPTCLGPICPGAYLSGTHLFWCPLVQDPFVWDPFVLVPNCPEPICLGPK